MINTSSKLLCIKPGGPFRGELALPGDKSIAHRSLIFAALAKGRSEIRHLPSGRDVASTLSALTRLGVPIRKEGDVAVVEGTGGRFSPPDGPIDCGNSGTSLRLLTGLLAGARVPCTLVGDESLSLRPMARVIDPLRQMGAQIQGTGSPPTAPIVIRDFVNRTLPAAFLVASAQVKTALLLAALFLEGETVLDEPVPSRDHTERMLSAQGVTLSRREDRFIHLTGPGRPRPFSIDIPGDPSSAAFFAAAAACAEGSEVRFRRISINPTRFAFFELLGQIGAAIHVENEMTVLGEPVADVTVRYKQRPGEIRIDGPQVPALIDELPLVGVLGCFAREPATVRDAAELRVKESDRIAAVCDNLTGLGVSTTAWPDGFRVVPARPRTGTVDAFGDHRIAMAFAVLGALAQGVRIRGADAIAISYPEFLDHLTHLCPDCRWFLEEA